jgi:cell division protein FtsI/penicillin-binding protein 2
MHLDVTLDDFNRYRDILKSYGLGTITGIDLPGEKIGIIGNKIAPDLLLNLAIVQYDTYTPIEMLQYINSIASGKRMSLSLMRNITSKEDIILEHEFSILNDIPLENSHLERIREGFRLVLSKGTGRYYVPQNVGFAGKTGTSESFLDTNNDGIIDTSTITKTFVGYYPYDSPKYSIVVIAPNIAVKNNNNAPIYTGASKITKKITSYLVENY